MRDSEVVASIVARKPDGLATAYDRYAAPLYTYCRSIVPDPADAADAVQDTFVLAASRIESLRDPNKLRSWLYAIARNECLRVLRDSKHIQATDEVPEVTDAGVDLGADAERAEKITLVQRPSMASTRASARSSNCSCDTSWSRPRWQTSSASPVTTCTRCCLVPGSSWRPAWPSCSSGAQAKRTAVAGPAAHRLGRSADRAAAQAGQPTHRALRYLHRRGVVLTPAALLDVSAAIALAYVAAPSALKDEVLRLGLGQDAAAVAHRAAVAKSAGAFRENGFPKAVHGTKGAVHHAPWRTSRQGQAAIAVAVVVAAVAAAAFAFALTGNNTGHHKVSDSGLRPPAFSAVPAPVPSPSTSGPHNKKDSPALPDGHPATASPAGRRTPQARTSSGTTRHATTPPGRRPTVRPTTSALPPTPAPRQRQLLRQCRRHLPRRHLPDAVALASANALAAHALAAAHASASPGHAGR